MWQCSLENYITNSLKWKCYFDDIFANCCPESFFSTFGGTNDENFSKILFLWTISYAASDENFVKQINISISVLVYKHASMDYTYVWMGKIISISEEGLYIPISLQCGLEELYERLTLVIQTHLFSISGTNIVKVFNMTELLNLQNVQDWAVQDKAVQNLSSHQQISYWHFKRRFWLSDKVLNPHIHLQRYKHWGLNNGYHSADSIS